MSNQCSYHLPNGSFFSYFYPIRKYLKYSLNLIFCCEYNDSPSLKKTKTRIQKIKENSETIHYVQKNLQIYFIRKENRFPDYFMNNFFLQFFNNFLVSSLCKINSLCFFHKVDVFIFKFLSRQQLLKILIRSHVRLRLCISCV